MNSFKEWAIGIGFAIYGIALLYQAFRGLLLGRIFNLLPARRTSFKTYTGHFARLLGVANIVLVIVFASLFAFAFRIPLPVDVLGLNKYNQQEEEVNKEIQDFHEWAESITKVSPSPTK